MRVLSGILIGLVSKLNFMLSRFEHEIYVKTSDPELTPSILISKLKQCIRISPEIIKNFSCFSQLCTNFIRLISD